MAPLIAIAFWIFGIVVIYGSLRSLHTRMASVRWWITSVAILCAALAIGSWAGFAAQYQPSETLRVFSFPIPVVFFVLETTADGTQRWTDFVVPGALFVASANAVFIASLPAIPIWIASKFITTNDSEASAKTQRT